MAEVFNNNYGYFAVILRLESFTIGAGLEDKFAAIYLNIVLI